MIKLKSSKATEFYDTPGESAMEPKFKLEMEKCLKLYLREEMNRKINF